MVGRLTRLEVWPVAPAGPLVGSISEVSETFIRRPSRSLDSTSRTSAVRCSRRETGPRLSSWVMALRRDNRQHLARGVRTLVDWGVPKPQVIADSDESLEIPLGDDAAVLERGSAIIGV